MEGKKKTNIMHGKVGGIDTSDAAFDNCSKIF